MHLKVSRYLYFTLAAFATGKQVLQQELILGNSLHRLDEIRRNRATYVVLLLHILYEKKMIKLCIKQKDSISNLV